MTGKSKTFWLLVAMSFLLIIAATVFWAVGTVLPRESELDVILHPEYQVAKYKNQVSVATYNIAFGHGLKSSPLEWRDKEHTLSKMNELAKVVRELNADILFLQEVDISSNRSHHINQAEHLVHVGKYPYSACAVIWEKNYIPFPFWPIKHHLGEVKTANCVLSRYPLSWHKRIIFEKPASNPFWYNWGYLDRGAHRIDVRIGDQNLTLINLHLEAYEQKAREEQSRFLGQWVSKIKGPIIIGGDFNSIPRDASKKSGFIDEPGVSFATDETLRNVKIALGDFSEAVPSFVCKINEYLCHTFPSDNATRRLDHLFAARGIKFIAGRVFHEASVASDHLPVVGVVDLNS